MGADLKEDPTFFDRADSFIRLANEHCSKSGRGKVSASLLYSSARFQAWNAACWADNAADMKAKREETVKYFLEQYKTMLEETLDDYIEHYAKYMQANGET
jgi:heme-binding NEAT domain protein